MCVCVIGDRLVFSANTSPIIQSYVKLTQDRCLIYAEKIEDVAALLSLPDEITCTVWDAEPGPSGLLTHSLIDWCNLCN